MINLQHQTPAQFAARLRARYSRANREQAGRIALKIADWIDAGDLTDLQVRSSFGLTVAQWAVLKARMQALRGHQQAIDAARGE